jgi:hypothetical protein
VIKFISEFNNDPSVHGILVQLPLPSVWFWIWSMFDNLKEFCVELWLFD